MKTQREVVIIGSSAAARRPCLRELLEHLDR